MLEELRTGSWRGIELEGMTFGQKLLSAVLACTVTVLLIVLPNFL
jgi:hypothetical protein